MTIRFLQSNLMVKTTAQTCKYCETMQKWQRDHESEILDKAGKFCINPHFREFVQSELDFVDHANLGPIEQISYLVHIHDKSGCHCQDQTIAEIAQNLGKI